MFELHFSEEFSKSSERVRWKEGSESSICSAGKDGLYDEPQKRGPTEVGPGKGHLLHFRPSLQFASEPIKPTIRQVSHASQEQPSHAASYAQASKRGDALAMAKHGQISYENA